MHDWYGFQTGVLIIFVAFPALVGMALGFTMARRFNKRGAGRWQSVSLGAVLGAVAGASLAIVLFRY